MTNNIDPRLLDIDNRQAPASSSFMYVGRLVVEEWTFLPLEKRQRGDYVRPDVPYYRLGIQPLSYHISDGGVEGDGLEWTTVAIKNVHGELTPKGSGRDELVQAFARLGFPRNTIHDLSNHPAKGKVFQFRRYTRQYTRREGGQTITVPGELMNVPWALMPDDWAPPPGQEVPSYTRRPRGAQAGPVQSGSVVSPAQGPTFKDVAEAIAQARIPLTEASVRSFVLDRNDLARGEILDLAMQYKLLAALQEQGLLPADVAGQ